jgi:two-component system, cell cycle response regulator DivK
MEILFEELKRKRGAAPRLPAQKRLVPGWQAPPERSAPSRSPFERREARAALVLIVEDFLDAREMLVDCLHFAGYMTGIAADGFEALEKAKDLRPDIILMDLAMPGLDGWSASEILKRDPATWRIPIIAVSAHALPSDEERARASGCAGFLAKPVNPEELLQEVSRTLRERSDDRGSIDRPRRRPS